MAAPTRELRKSWGLSRTPPACYRSILRFSFAPSRRLSLILSPVLSSSLYLSTLLPSMSLSLSLPPPSSVREGAHATSTDTYMDVDVGGEDWRAGAGGLIPVPRGSRSAPHLREGAAASQTFRAETRFLTGNFVRLRLPHPAAASSSAAAARSSLEFFEFSRSAHGQSCPPPRSAMCRASSE